MKRKALAILLAGMMAVTTMGGTAAIADDYVDVSSPVC